MPKTKNIKTAINQLSKKIKITSSKLKLMRKELKQLKFEQRSKSKSAPVKKIAGKKSKAKGRGRPKG